MSNQQNPNPAMPARDSVTQYQVASLLGVIKQLENLALFQHDDERADDDQPRRLDGGTYDAVTTTIINACARLDSILLNPDRWQIAMHDELYASMLKTQNAAIASLKQQEATFAAASTPSALFKPSLTVHGDEFIASWGATGYSVLGRGPTPYAALADFNLAFLRTPREMLDRITDILADAQFPKPTKKKKKSDEPED